MVTGAQAGTNAVQNNYLSKAQKAQRDKEMGECPTLVCSTGTATKWTAIDIAQDASFTIGAAAAAGAVLGLNDTVDSIVHTAGSLKETYAALKAVVESGGVWDAVKQPYIDRIDRLQAQYEEAGASGSYQAGVETGKLISDMAAVLSVGGGVVKGGALLAEKVTAKVAARAELVVVKANPAWDNVVSKADGDFGYLPPVRQMYVKDVYDLQGAVDKMRASGASSEEVAKFAYGARNDITLKYREYTPPEVLRTIDARNMERYGSKIGPQFDDLINKGKTFDQVIESSTRAGGGDLF